MCGTVAFPAPTDVSIVGFANGKPLTGEAWRRSTSGWPPPASLSGSMTWSSASVCQEHLLSAASRAPGRALPQPCRVRGLHRRQPPRVLPQGAGETAPLGVPSSSRADLVLGVEVLRWSPPAARPLPSPADASGLAVLFALPPLRRGPHPHLRPRRRSAVIRQHLLGVPASIIAAAPGYHHVTAAKLTTQASTIRSRNVSGCHTPLCPLRTCDS